MRYKEITTPRQALEGRGCTETDDAKLLQELISKTDNIYGLYPYAKNVNLTIAVTLLAIRSDCKWFFDFLTTQLHSLEEKGVQALRFYLNKCDDELQIWAKEDGGQCHVYPNKPATDFPLNGIKLRALREENLWHVSFCSA